MREYIDKIWEHLHSIAEPSREEKKTSEFIINELEQLNFFEIEKNVNGTHGVIAKYDSGKPGPVLGLRSDMDALTYDIDGKTEYRHMCGHDAHMTMLLTAAKIIAERGIQKGKLVLVFQPAEETLVGAIPIAESGLLDEVEEIVGMHIRPTEDPVQVGQASARMHYSAAAPTIVKIKGVASHGARPHLGISASYGAVLIANAIMAIQTNPYISSSIKVTNINTGRGANNSIPSNATMALDIRSESNEEIRKIMDKARKAVEGAADAAGVEVEIDQKFCPASEYTDKTVSMVEECIVEALGEGNAIGEYATAGGEDFNHYGRILKIDNGFVALGAKASPGLHAQNMTFDHDAMENGVKIYLTIVNKRLGLND